MALSPGQAINEFKKMSRGRSEEEITAAAQKFREYVEAVKPGAQRLDDRMAGGLAFQFGLVLKNGEGVDELLKRMEGVSKHRGTLAAIRASGLVPKN